jgi:hypothetical protein
MFPWNVRCEFRLEPGAEDSFDVARQRHGTTAG